MADGTKTYLATKADLDSYVPTSTTVNNKALTGNISLTASDVGARASDWMPTAAQVGAAASSHNHGAGDINSGTLAVARGGTGATTLALARNAMGLGNTTGALPIANGGTGATTAALARNALGLGNTNGAVPIANGGTGATTAAGALSAIGAAASSHNHAAGNITSGTLGVARGGTGQSSLGPTVTTVGVRGIYGGTGGMTPSSTALTTGMIYLQYE